jgi:hypothetical protein
MRWKKWKSWAETPKKMGAVQNLILIVVEW